nr:MAG TPA: hypothetical protein [Caudoviricetes sp.]
MKAIWCIRAEMRLLEVRRVLMKVFILIDHLVLIH